jgi:hypothetical protein
MENNDGTGWLHTIHLNSEMDMVLRGMRNAEHKNSKDQNRMGNNEPYSMMPESGRSSHISSVCVPVSTKRYFWATGILLSGYDQILKESFYSFISIHRSALPTVCDSSYIWYVAADKFAVAPFSWYNLSEHFLLIQSHKLTIWILGGTSLMAG